MLLPSLEMRADGTPTKMTAIPFYFLVSHAAELLLKAALLKRGFSEDALRKRENRHSLSSLLNELQNRRVSVTPGTVRLIDALHLPPLVAVLEMLDELLLLTRTPLPT